MPGMVGRQETSALMGVQQANEIFKLVSQKSVALSAMRRLRNMSSKQTKMIILDNLPTAYFVDGDTGRKETTKMAWKNKFITAEEIAVIIPFPESVIADSSFNIENEAIPSIVEAFATKIDDAILNGNSAPASWPMGLIPLTKNQGNVVSLAANETDQDLYKKILGYDGLFHAVEKDGYMVNGLIGSLGMKAKLRGLTDTTGRPLSIGGNDIDGMKVNYVMNGTWSDDDAYMIAGDFTKAVYAMRQDITIKRCTEGVIQDSAGDIVYNLMQNDMIALRFVMRLGWQVANPVSLMNPDETSRYPFAVLTKQAAPALKKITFTVQDAEETPNPIEGATVSLGDVSRVTSSTGKVEISVNENYSGTYIVAKDGNAKTGTTGVVTEDKAITVTLA